MRACGSLRLTHAHASRTLSWPLTRAPHCACTSRASKISRRIKQRHAFGSPALAENAHIAHGGHGIKQAAASAQRKTTSMKATHQQNIQNILTGAWLRRLYLRTALRRTCGELACWRETRNGARMAAWHNIVAARAPSLKISAASRCAASRSA